MARLAATAEVPAPDLAPNRTTSMPSRAGGCRSVVMCSSLAARLARGAGPPDDRPVPTRPGGRPGYVRAKDPPGARVAAPTPRARPRSAGPARPPARPPGGGLLAVPLRLRLTGDLRHQPAQV